MAVMKDVAKLAGVSVSAVSKYLNHPDKMTQEYRDRIQSAIDELNYVPSNVARSMRTGKTNVIALIIPELTNPYYSEVYNAVYSACFENDYLLTVYTTEEKSETLSVFLSNINKLRADGIIMAFVDEDEIMQKINEVENMIPTTLISWDTTNDRFNSVEIDLYDGIYKAAKHMIDIGHTNIAYVGGIAKSRISKEKFAGFKKALSDAGLSLPDDYVAAGKYRFKTGFNATKTFMRLDQPPKAIVAANDILAIGCVKYLVNNGYKVPEDCAVIGFDGINLSKIYDPTISTIEQPISDMGTAAVRLLIENIRNANAKRQQVIYDTKLIVRRSTDADAPLVLDI